MEIIELGQPEVHLVHSNQYIASFALFCSLVKDLHDNREPLITAVPAANNLLQLYLNA